MSSPASTRTHDSARPGDGRGDLEPQITTFKLSSSSKNFSPLLTIFCRPIFRSLSCTECEFKANRPMR